MEASGDGELLGMSRNMSIGSREGSEVNDIPIGRDNRRLPEYRSLLCPSPSTALGPSQRHESFNAQQISSTRGSSYDAFTEACVDNYTGRQNEAPTAGKTRDSSLTDSFGLRAGRGSRDLRGDMSSSMPDWKRTISGAEEGRPMPKRKTSIFSTLLQFGFDQPRALESESRADLQENSRRPSLFTLVAGTTGRRPSLFSRQRRNSEIVAHVEDVAKGRKFILKLAQALLTFGAPSHRIESQLNATSRILEIGSEFVHLPNLIIVSFNDGGTRSFETHFVRASGRIALTSLHKVHLVCRDVLHDKMGAEAGASALRKILRAPPRYNLFFRCALSFFSATILCSLAFGGSFVDMLVGGASSSILQFLGLNAAAKSAIYANVYEISISILMSFIARALSTIPNSIFCYAPIASTGVASVLPGFTILISALELTSANIMCGSVRMVYAVIYTLFLGFGLTIGSELYLVFNTHARYIVNHAGATEIVHGEFMAKNGSNPFLPLGGTFTFTQVETDGTGHIYKQCFRDPSWQWWRQPLPWWTMFFFVPIYSMCASLANLQSWRSKQLFVMVVFSSAAYAANKATGLYISDRGDIVSAFGAFVIGMLGNVYSRVIRGTAFTSMVTGVLFIVPSALGQGGGIIQNYSTSVQQYSNGFNLGVRMIQVAVGITIGLFVSQIIVYAFGRRKNAAYFAF